MSSIRFIKVIVFLAMMSSLSATAHGFHKAEAVKTSIDNVTVIDAINGLRENQTIVFEGDEILISTNKGRVIREMKYSPLVSLGMKRSNNASTGRASM